MFSPVTLFPAPYIQQPKTAEAMQMAWDNGLDFQDGKGGPYCSIRNIKQVSYMASSVTLMSRDGSLVVHLK